MDVLPGSSTEIGTDDRDLRLWLITKLEGPWSSTKLSPLLSKDVLQMAFQIFPTLETPIKIKLLFACISIPKKDLGNLQAELESLFFAAQKDESEWVQVVASLLSTFGDGAVSLDSLKQNSTSAQVIAHLIASMISLYFSFLNVQHPRL